jgi:DNA-directed RNA polymerase specialized sigma24 family protein
MKRQNLDAVLDGLGTLFEGGTASGLSDGHLLERYLSRPDGAGEAAFAAIVKRHGPMVHRVCRGVLGEWHDADDAYQATFLILARKANSIRAGGSVGSWLYGVARRVAVRARDERNRRTQR